MQDSNKENTTKDFFNIEQNKSVMNVDAQKELLEHQAKISFSYAIKILFVIFPAIFLFIGIVLFIIFKIVKII